MWKAAAGSSLAKRKIIEKKLAIAQEAMKADQRALQPVQKLLDDLDREVSKIKSTSFGVLKDRLSFSGSVVFLGKSAKAGARVATIAAGEGIETVFRTIGIGANAARIGLFSVSAIFFPFDIYTLVDSSMQIDNARKEKRESEPEVVKMLKGLAEALEKEMDEMLRTMNDVEESLNNSATVF